MRLGFGLPMAVVCAVSVAASASMAATCPSRPNMPSDWCVQKPKTSQPKQQQPGPATQRKPPDPKAHLPPGSTKMGVPAAPPPPSSAAGKQGVPKTWGIPAVPPPPSQLGSAPPSQSQRPPGADSRVPQGPFQADPGSMTSTGAAPSSQPRRSPAPTGAVYSPAPGPGQHQPSGTPTRAAAEHLVVCWIDNVRHCKFLHASPVPSRTVCSCDQLQGLTQ
jgi:hypothetical protein